MILYNGKTVIYSIFQRGDTLYLVSTYWSIHEPPLAVFVNGVRATESGRNEYEPVRYFYVPAVEDPSTIIVTINDVEYRCSAEVMSEHKGEFAMATLFKDDNYLLPMFIDYYRKQGIEAFYLYYNGEVLPDNCPQGNDIHYRIWNYQYWNHTNWDIGRTIWAHAAQPAMITDAMLRYKPLYDWFGFFDLDELIYVNEKYTLKKYLSIIPNNISVVRAHSYWTDISGDTIQYYAKGVEPMRGKCLYRTTYTNFCGIHYPKVKGDIYESPHAKMLHIIHDKTSDRRKYIPLMDSTLPRSLLFA
jgi:hypothetical protein